MSRNQRYVRRVIGKDLREKLTAALLPELGEKTPFVVHFMDEGFLLDEVRVKHYLIWLRYRELLSTTPRTPRDIILELASDNGYDESTIERILRKRAQRAPIQV